MDNDAIYKQIQVYVEDLFNKNSNNKLVYHNLDHTKEVVRRAKEIAAHYSLTDKEMLTLYAGSWFHDVGQLFTKGWKDHEEESINVMKGFMHDHKADDALIKGVEACICATKMPTSPTTLIEKIICDADTYHLGTKDFKENNKNVRAEYTLREHEIDKDKWREGTINMLEHHKFYTDYCKDLLDDQKKENIKKLKKKLKKNDADNGSLEINEANSFTSKGIQTMLRLTSENHLKLSDMADHKANILISVNAIIISVILGVLMRKLEEDAYLTIPTIIFLIVAVTTIVIAILATMPKVTEGTFSDQDIIDKKTNLLFFGNFYKSSFEKYDTAMRTMMQEPDYLYGSLIKDIYSLGIVLGKKYRLIRMAYYIFMVGIVVSVIAFGIAVFIYNTSAHPAAATGASAFPL